MLLDGSSRRDRGACYGTFTERGGDALKAGFDELEYTKFPIAHEKAVKLLMKCSIIVNELVMEDGSSLLPPLCVVLKAALYLLKECEKTAALGERVLLYFSYANYFSYLNKCLKLVWACPPSWNEPYDDPDDINTALGYLKDKRLWDSYRGEGELWKKLDNYVEDPEKGRGGVISQYTRRCVAVDMRDVTYEGDISESEYCTVRLGAYRGTAVVVKEVKEPYVTHETVTECMLTASDWIGVFHPHVVSIIGCAVMSHYRENETPQTSAILVTGYAPGPTLLSLWHATPHPRYPDLKHLLTLCKQAAEALLYLTLPPLRQRCPTSP